MSIKDENLKVVYNEVVELHRQHQAGIDLIYNKLNWILVSDLVFLAAVYNTHRSNVFIVVLISVSAILSLRGLRGKTFKHTEKISDQLNKLEDPNLLEHLIQKKREAFIANESRNKETTKLMDYASWCLITALALQSLLIILK